MPNNQPPVEVIQGEDRHALCLLIDGMCPKIDDFTGLPIGTEVETLADAICAMLAFQSEARAGEFLGGWLPCPFCAAPLSEPMPAQGSSLLFRFHPGVVTDKDCILAGKGFGDKELAAWNQRPSHPLPDREAIARIVDPNNWRLVDHWRALPNRPDLEIRIPGIVGDSLNKADAILSLTPSPGGEGSK